jgi:GNAT superfamily N-acetyltransferase
MAPRVGPMSRDEIGMWLDDVATLRIGVFAEFPYLYCGDMEYERRYLAVYRESPKAIVVGAWDGERLVGASTGTPMEDHSDDFSGAWSGTGIPIDHVFYCAESVLMPEYRGQGIGGQFFDHREAHARALGRDWSAFCAVIRPEDHPMRPENYVPHDAFWTRRGYRTLSGAIAKFSWKDHGEAAETEKRLQFWIRNLREERA